MGLILHDWNRENKRHLIKAADFDGWCKEAGFKQTEVIPLAGPTSAGIAYK